MTRFIIVADKLTALQHDVLTEIVKGKGWGFWHWYESTWLLNAVPDHVTSKALAEELDADPSLAGKSILVMKLSDPIGYFGRAPEESWNWMRDNWGKTGV